MFVKTINLGTENSTRTRLGLCSTYFLIPNYMEISHIVFLDYCSVLCINSLIWINGVSSSCCCRHCFVFQVASYKPTKH